MTACAFFCVSQLAREQVTIGNLLQFLFPTSLVASSYGKRISWLFNQKEGL